ncbi:MAG: T9SS type A sorting domain-containing protein [Ignavibacteriales bacterium]|nr:T9SS type A sorting domain-containing protein [Ignavibacteriales bacterium]
MKKIVFVLLSVFLFQNLSFANRQHVHQRLVIEGYKLLKMWIGNNPISIMNNKIGDYSNIGINPWEQGFLTTGAWREDVEDVVYNYSLNNPPLIAGFTANLSQALGWALGNDNNDGWISITHFWDADAGDEIATTMNGSLHFITDNAFQVTIPNAYQKMKHYASGDFDLRIQIMIQGFPNGNGVPCAAQWAWVNFRYGYLPTFFKNKILRVSKIEWGDGSVTNYPNLPTFNSNHYYGLNAQTFTQFKDNICWEVLGRMCHLLQDMGVPTHANVDPHGDNSGLRIDSFENSFGDIGWTADMVYNINQEILEPLICEDPIHFLMYTTQQQANHFASNGPHMHQRNDVFGGNYYNEEIDYLNSLNVSSYGNPIEMGENLSIENISSKMIPQMIRATAGLLYWFAMETDLLENTLFINCFNSGDILINSSNLSSGYRVPTWNNPSSVTLQAIDQVYDNCYWRFQNWQKIVNGTVVQTFTTRNITITPTANTTYKANFTSENYFFWNVTGPLKGLYRGESRVFNINANYGNPPANYYWHAKYRSIYNGQIYWTDGLPDGCSISFISNGSRTATFTNNYFSKYCSSWADSVIRVYGNVQPAGCGCSNQTFFEEITLKDRTRPGYPPPPPPPGGCPYVYTWNGNTWVEENNILPQSQTPDILGENVTDYYQLYTKPVEEDGKYYLAISEYEEDKSYFDQFKLLVIDHPEETFITIDDSGTVIQFAKPAFFANAQLDSNDVYKQLLSLDDIKTEVSESDVLSLSFEDVNSGNENWLLLVGQVEPIAKDKVSGKMISKNNGGKENSATFSSFRLRRNPTYQWVLAPTSSSSTLQIDIAWQENAQVDYTELSNRLELPFILSEAELLTATHSALGDIKSELMINDGIISELNKNEWIELGFSIPPTIDGMQRSFVFVSNGRYEHIIERYKYNVSGKNQLLKNSAESSRPLEYRLEQNYPNPFNPTSTINYSVKENGYVRLKVYDIIGNEVAELLNGNLTAGNYSVEFNAGELPSGVYIYSIQVNNFFDSKKMILIK